MNQCRQEGTQSLEGFETIPVKIETLGAVSRQEGTQSLEGFETLPVLRAQL